MLVVSAAASTPSQAKKVAASAGPHSQEPIIEEVTAKQLEKLLREKDYVAVFWCKYPRQQFEKSKEKKKSE